MTTPYHIKIAPAASTAWLLLSAKQQKTLLKLIGALSVNPRPPGVRKIEGMTGLYCEDIEQRRVIYKVEDQDVLILLIQ